MHSSCLTAKIVFAVIGILSGVSIFACFSVAKNMNAAIWGLLSAVFAAIVLRLLIAYKKDVLVTTFTLTNLRLLKQFGAFGSFAAIIAAVTYFTLVIVLKQGYKMEDNGYMPAGIFSLLTLKWTAILFFNSKHYEKIYSDDEEKPIANNEEKPIANGGST